jgi:predicted MFS family arabinose efflux permease
MKEGMAMGIRQAALPLGGALAAVFFPALILRTGWAWAMVAAAVVIVVTGGIYLAVFRNASRPEALSSSAAPVWRQLLVHFMNPALRRIALIGAMLAGLQMVVSVFWAMFVQHRFELTASVAAWSLFIVQMSGALGRVMLSALSDHIRGGRRRVVISCLALAPVALLVTALLPMSYRDLTVPACAAVIGFLSIGWYGPWVVWLSESAEHKNVGEVISAAMAVNQVTIAIAPFVFGLVTDAAGTPTLPLLCLAGGLGLVFLWELMRPIHSFRGDGEPGQ